MPIWFTTFYYTKTAKIAIATSAISNIFRVQNPVPVSDILHCNALAREENIETQAHEIMAKLEMPNSYLRRELL